MEKSIAIKKTNIIIFFDNSKLELTEQENKVIENMCIQGLSGFELNNSKYKFNDIRKWLTVADYYKLYPDEKEPFYANFPTINETLANFTIKQRIKAVKNMVKGFEKHFQGKKMPENSSKMLSGMKFRLEKLKMENLINS